MPASSDLPAARAAAAPRANAQPDATALVQNLAHELRQPMSTIESIAYYLSIVLPRENPRLSGQLQRLQEQIQQINSILDDTVYYLGAVPRYPRPIDLNDLVRRCVDRVPVGAPVRMNLAEKLPAVRLDREQARHFFRSVISVFRRLAPGTEPVTISTSATGAVVQFEVYAAGAPLGPSERQDLWEPFAAALPPSAGLSMASAKRIAEAHGAVMDLEPGESGGLRLTVTFPAAT
ncbi:MAG TPA: HAMP domain-containing sensor histidine kinase [Bryobacteraceae bacterium]|nr:HAMP domain-containing sensor histidine kinase [Bryobacteraceae bacterium]